MKWFPLAHSWCNARCDIFPCRVAPFACSKIDINSPQDNGTSKTRTRVFCLVPRPVLGRWGSASLFAQLPSASRPFFDSSPKRNLNAPRIFIECRIPRINFAVNFAVNNTFLSALPDLGLFFSWKFHSQETVAWGPNIGVYRGPQLVAHLSCGCVNCWDRPKSSRWQLKMSGESFLFGIFLWKILMLPFCENA